MISSYDPTLSRSQRMLLEITEAGKRVQSQTIQTARKAPSSPVEPRSVEELLALVDSLTSAQKALAERSSTDQIGGVPLDRVAGLVAQMIENRRRAREELQRLC